MKQRHWLIGPWLAMGLALLTGCAGGPTNPSFAVSVDDAKADLKRMEASPVVLKRPVIVIGGWADPFGIPPSRLARQLRDATGDERIIAIGMGGLTSFDHCRQRVIERVQQQFPGDDDTWTAPVDVVGFSMGGLVAQDAHRPITPSTDDAQTQRRLRIVRLFTIATPIRGAAAANRFGITSLTRRMKSGSEHISTLADAFDEADYAAFHYVRLDDPIVGEANAAPPDQTAWWIPSRPLELAHLHAYKDPRIVADIARRLRGERPHTTHPPAPLPQQQSSPR